MAIAHRVEFWNGPDDWRLVAVYKTEQEARERCQEIKEDKVPEDFLKAAVLRVVKVETIQTVVYRA